jgi:lysophospholipase L1-like esterase
MKSFARFLSLALLLALTLSINAQEKQKAKGAPAPAPVAIDPSLAIPATDDGLPGAGPIRRYEWFQKLWSQRRSTWAQRVATDQGALVFLGDSITQGWGDDFKKLFPGLKLANRGISGDTTRGVLIRLQKDVLALKPAGIVLLIGTNDLEEGADPETIANNLKLILAALKAHNPQMPIVLCQVFPSSATKKRSAEAIQKINALYADAVRGDKQITLIETWTLFANAAGDAKPEEFPDLLHPNLAGYQKWAGALKPIFATLGFIETEPDTFQPEPGFVSLFNGKDLTGWGFRPTPPRPAPKKNAKPNPAAPVFVEIKEPETFDGKAESSDGRYVAKNGRLIVTTPAEGRRIQQLWTTREFPKDFILKLEFRATPNADSGVFIRQPQLQCRDYPLAGPYKDLKNYKAGDWNELVVTVTGTNAVCTCNGEMLTNKFPLPLTGPIGLEGDRGQMEYRRIRVKEQP